MSHSQPDYKHARLNFEGIIGDLYTIRIATPVGSLAVLKPAFVKPAAGDLGAFCRLFLTHNNTPTATSPQTTRAPTTPPTIAPTLSAESMVTVDAIGSLVLVVGGLVVVPADPPVVVVLVSSERHFQFELINMIII